LIYWLDCWVDQGYDDYGGKVYSKGNPGDGKYINIYLEINR